MEHQTLLPTPSTEPQAPSIKHGAGKLRCNICGRIFRATSHETKCPFGEKHRAARLRAGARETGSLGGALCVWLFSLTAFENSGVAKKCRGDVRASRGVASTLLGGYPHVPSYVHVPCPATHVRSVPPYVAV